MSYDNNISGSHNTHGVDVIVELVSCLEFRVSQYVFEKHACLIHSTCDLQETAKVKNQLATVTLPSLSKVLAIPVF